LNTEKLVNLIIANNIKIKEFIISDENDIFEIFGE